MKPSVATKHLSAMALFCVTASTLLQAQNPQLRTKYAARFPTVVFSSVRWNANPPYYSIAIDATGTATYQAGSNSPENAGVPFTTEFQVGDKTRRIVFNVTRKLEFFAGSYGENTSSPGRADVQTLSYLYGTVHNQVTYTTASDPDLEELTSVFQELSETFEFGRKIMDLEVHNRRGVAALLQTMQQRADRHSLRDLHALVPILREVASDDRLDASTRNADQTLLTIAQAAH